MDIELIDKAWACLPKEFKEEVKEIYLNAMEHHPCGYNHKTDLLKYLFGHHNLTSDADEEERLCVKREWVQEMYKNNCDEIRRENISSSDRDCYEYANEVLKTLFGSKCMPDEKDSATCQDKTCKNYDTDNKHCRFIEHCSYEPKPAEPKVESRNLSQATANCDKQFDNILKDGFRNERRLNIAAQILGSIVASGKPCRQPVKRALELTDALVAECEKGGDNA